MNPLLVALLVTAVVLSGVYCVAVIDAFAGARSRREFTARPFSTPLRQAAVLLLQQQSRTERPDTAGWILAPAIYLALAGAGLSLVPPAAGRAAVDVEAGIVLWGAIEALTVVAVFLHGWSANSLLPLIGGYRYVATGLMAMLVSMFVLIAAALPAGSLNVGDIVASQEGVWNVVRQPLGLPLFLLLGLSVSLRGPFNYADSADLAGGTEAEASGAARLGWRLARNAMLVSFAAMAASVFLGGYRGPFLPGPAWLLIKTLLVLAVLAAAGRWLVRITPSRMLTLAWVVLLPLAFLHLLFSGIVALA